MKETLLRSLLWLALGGWVGAWAFFAFVVSRIAFQVLPGDIAGDLAGELLAVLHVGGAVAAFVIAGANRALGRPGWMILFPLVLGAACIASEIFLSPAVAAVRPSTLGAESTMEAQQRFRLLHGASLGLFMAIHAASIALLVLQSRQDAREASPVGRSRP
jgi:hypothetical protein